jgi:hypothetical protein
LARLEAVFGDRLKSSGVRQVFVITDGEVSNTDQVIECARNHRSENRCFSIGIGGCADAGMIEGIADATGGRADFVGSGEDLSLKVIPQLELSFVPSITDVTVDIECHESIEISPFPIHSITPNVCSTFFVRSSSPFSSSQSILISGQYADQVTDTVVEIRRTQLTDCLMALFALESGRCLERDLKLGRGNREELRSRAVALSISGGVLSTETSFVGVSQKIYGGKRQRDRRSIWDYAVRHQKPTLDSFF